jgi:DNA-binding CsgD family transcriptional regulator
MNKLANCYFLDGRFKKSMDLIDEIILLSKEKDIQHEEEKAIELKLKVLNASSNYKQLDEVTHNLVKMKNKHYSSQITELLSGLESKNLIFRKQKEIELKENEISVEKNSKYKLVLFGVILILSLGLLVAYFISRKVYLEKQFIISEQKERIANSNLEHKKIELAMLSTNIVKENELISSISEDLKNYVSLLKEEKEQKLFLPLMNKLNIELKDKNKDESYSDQFNAAYPGYLESLIRSCPQLSASELKVCTFLRLNLNSKEIAEIMQISVRSVESRRYRLRKKLKLNKETDLVNYLISLSNNI